MRLAVYIKIILMNAPLLLSAVSCSSGVPFQPFCEDPPLDLMDGIPCDQTTIRCMENDDPAEAAYDVENYGVVVAPRSLTCQLTANHTVDEGMTLQAGTAITIGEGGNLQIGTLVEPWDSPNGYTCAANQPVFFNSRSWPDPDGSLSIDTGVDYLEACTLVDDFELQNPPLICAGGSFFRLEQEAPEPFDRFSCTVAAGLFIGGDEIPVGNDVRVIDAELRNIILWNDQTYTVGGLTYLPADESYYFMSDSLLAEALEDNLLLLRTGYLAEPGSLISDGRSFELQPGTFIRRRRSDYMVDMIVLCGTGNQVDNVDMPAGVTFTRQGESALLETDYSQGSLSELSETHRRWFDEYPAVCEPA